MHRTRLVSCCRSRLGSRRYASTSSDDYDIVIVGGGPAGLALTSALASSEPIIHSSRIALIEALDLSPSRNWTPESNKFSNRVSSITNSTRSFLKDIGAWKYVDEGRTTPVESMQVWDGLSDARISFSPSDLSLPHTHEMARMTENINLQHALLKHLSQYGPQIQLIDKVKVSSIEREKGNSWPVVRISDGRALRTRLLIGADGFNSPVRHFAQIPSHGWSYPTHAIVSTLHHPTSFNRKNTTAYQRFLPTGPIASLPLSPTTSSLVWSTTPSLASIIKSLAAEDPRVLPALVNAAFRLPEISIRHLHTILEESHSKTSPLTTTQILDEIKWREKSHLISPQSPLFSSDISQSTIGVPPIGTEDYPPFVSSIQPGSVASFPLRYSHADAYVGEGVGERTVLVGDAAHTVHPLSGQGLNMGLADAKALTKCIEEAVLNGGDIGSYTSLIPYSRARYFENHKLLSATDKLHKLYSTTLPPVVWARSVGLEVVNEWSALKGALMGEAGAEGDSESGGGSYWEMASKGVGSVVGGVDFVKGVVGALVGSSGKRSV